MIVADVEGIVDVEMTQESTQIATPASVPTPDESVVADVKMTDASADQASQQKRNIEEENTRFVRLTKEPRRDVSREQKPRNQQLQSIQAKYRI
jgi:hypothetical protein